MCISLLILRNKLKIVLILSFLNFDSNLNFPRNLEGATRWLGHRQHDARLNFHVALHERLSQECHQIRSSYL